jgi:hypothetical protein
MCLLSRKGRGDILDTTVSVSNVLSSHFSVLQSR